MCGRSSITKNEKELEKRFNAYFYSEDLERYNSLPNYNISPTNFVPIITSKAPNKLQFAHWGLISSISKNSSRSSSMINARMETILQKKSFKNLVSSNRCIVPLDGYYEWEKLSAKVKIPHYITAKDNSLFSVAGVWDKWVNEKNESIISFTIVTINAPEFMMQIHPRTPGILDKNQELAWLDNSLSDNEALSIITPVREHQIKTITVSRKVNSVRNNNINLIEEVKYADPGKQLSLF